MLLAKLKIVRRLPSIWGYRKIIVHNYFRLMLEFLMLGIFLFYRKKMITHSSTIYNVPVLGKWERRILNFFYDKKLVNHSRHLLVNDSRYLSYKVLLSNPKLIEQVVLSMKLTAFNHGDGTGTVYLGGYKQGFYAAVISAMEGAYQCARFGLLPRFVWGKNYLYFDSHLGTNVWEYFFKQPSSLPSLFLEEDYQNDPFNTVAGQIAKHFYTDLMLPKIIEPIQDICLDDCIGIQFRSIYFRRAAGLLARHEISNHIVYEAYREAIQQALDQPGVRSDKIFFATDSELVVDKFKEMFPGQIMVTSSTRYKTTEGFVSDYETSGYQKGIEVIRDVELLSRCAYLIHGSQSSMSRFLRYRNPAQHRISAVKYLQSN